jgi:hypothetical protein
MKRSTLWLLVTALVLAVVTWFATRPDTPPPAPRLAIEGYATAEQLAAEKGRGMLDEPVRIESPIDGIVLEWPNRPRIELKRVGEGTAATWEIVAPQKGMAQGFMVDQITALFKSPTVSREARRYQENDARLFGFEPERRVRLTLMSKGAVWNGADLIIGDVRRERGGDGREPPDTWVMKADDPQWVFAVAAKDLRQPLDRQLADLRDKKVFRFKPDELVSVRVEPPRGTPFELKASTPPAPPEGETPATPAEWTLAEPTGASLDTAAKGFPRQVADLRAQGFEPEAAMPEAAKTALDLARPAWRYTLTTKDNAKWVLVVSEPTDDKAWGRIEGSGEVFSLAAWGQRNIAKSLEDLRDRTVLGFDPTAADRIDAPMSDGRAIVAKVDGVWKFSAPASPAAADPTAWLAGLKDIRAQRWARSDEKATATAALAQPALEVRLGRGETELAHIRVSATFDEDGQQLRWGVVGSGDPFIVSDFNAKKLEASVDAWRAKKLVAWTADEVMQVEVALEGQETFVITRDAASKALAVTQPASAANAPADGLAGVVRALVGLEARTFETEPWEKAIAGATTKGTVRLMHASGATLSLKVAYRGDDKDPIAVAEQGALAGTVVTIPRWELDAAAKLPSAPATPTPAAPAP